MPLPGIRAATSFLDEMQRDLLETEDQDFDGFFDRWSALGVPEIDEYRGDRRRGRGEVISEVGKIRRAIEKRPEILREAETDESPILTGARRIARGAGMLQGLMDNGGIAPTSMPASASAASMDFSPEPPDFEAETGNTARHDGDFATGELEQFLISRNLRGFPRAGICDSRCGLVKEASLHDKTTFH